MKIGLIYHQWAPKGGLERYLLAFAEHLAAAGHELTLVGSQFGIGVEKIRALRHRIAPPPFSSAWLIQRFAVNSAAWATRWKNEAENRDDHAVLGFGLTYCQDIHRAGGGCHAVYSKWLPWYRRHGWKNHLHLNLERKLYTGNLTKHFVVNSAKVGREIQNEYGVAAERITVIRTAVDTVTYAPAAPGHRSTLRKELSPETGTRPVFLMVSWEHRRKGLATALGALTHHSDAELWLVGKPLDRSWKAEIQRLGLTGRVRAFGERKDLPRFYQCADVFLHPSHYDACANTVLQSLACGLPSVVSCQDGASEFIREAENGWCLQNANDRDELAIKMGLALRASDALRTAARQTALPLTWERHLAEWMALIERARKEH